MPVRRGTRHRAVARQEDLDRLVERAGDPAEGPGERVDDVAEAAGLGPRLALGGDEDDAHGADGSPRGEPGTGRVGGARLDRGPLHRPRVTPKSMPWPHQARINRRSGFRARCPRDADRGIDARCSRRRQPSRDGARTCRRAQHRRAEVGRGPSAVSSRPDMEPLVRVPTLPGAPFRLPPQFEGLRRLAYNLWWMWHPRAALLFQRIDATTWSRYRNPIAVLESAINWQPLLDDPGFIAEYEDVLADFDRYMANGADHWFHRAHARQLDGPIAYFCAEYGFHESLGIYSGGLGVLAGDHMKSASDMALPLVGVGLLYRKGYFRQSIDADGHQEHAYPDFDLARLPVLRVLDRMGDPLHVPVELPGPHDPGRRLDAPGGPRAGPAPRHGPPRQRRAPTARSPTSSTSAAGRCGSTRSWSSASAACAPCARWASRRRSGTSTRATRRSCSSSGPARWSPPARPWPTPGPPSKRASVFTIHTPVSAGNERFDADLVRRVAGPLCAGDGQPGRGASRSTTSWPWAAAWTTTPASST